jgi:hypothetical protein
MAIEQPLPSLVSLLICDQVIDDRLTNKKSAIGLFNTVLVRQVPATIHQMVVLAALTEIQGEIGVGLRLVRDADNATLFHAQEKVRAPDPLATVDLLFGLHGFQLAHAGQYAIELMSGTALLGRRRFRVLERPPQDEPPPETN